MNLSFAGCGFLGIYHVGVAVCFKKYAPHLLLGKISGASFGALSACCLLCELPIGEITSDVLRVVGEARAGSLGPFSPSFNIQNVLLEGMQKYLPHDVHKIVSGRLHVSLTRVYDGKNVIVSEFPTREDLLQALLASCFVPVFSGLVPPRFHGVRYMDGGFSDNLPVLDENTITVSPFCGESDICPRDLSSQLFHVNVANTSIELSRQNMSRFARILFPPRAEVLSAMCRQGFEDALRFLQRNELISCTRCLSLHATLEHALRPDAPDCEQCRAQRRDAQHDALPDTVMTIFQEAIDSANSGVLNWVLQRRAVRCLALLALPYRVPADVLYATLTKVARNTPPVSRALWRLSRAVLQQLRASLSRSHPHHDPLCYKLHPRTYRRESVERLQQLLSVTSQQEALLKYYYLDEQQHLNVTEIYDVTDADTDLVQSPDELDINRQLEFDEWGSQLDTLHLDDEMDDEPLDLDDEQSDHLDEDHLADNNMFSEPESEWHTHTRGSIAHT